MQEIMKEMLDKIDTVPWERIIDMGSAIDFKIKADKENLIKVRKELNTMKIVLSERIKYSSGVGSFDPKLIMDILSLLERVDSLAREYELDLEHFRFFLLIVLEKLKHERFAARKTSKLDFHSKTILDEDKI